jgi:hypothetical protein
MDLATATYEVEPIPRGDQPPHMLLHFRVVEVIDDKREVIALRARRDEADEIVKACTECRGCRQHWSRSHGGGPKHNGSRMCESGSIASGGKNAHCTCDTCF